MAQKCSCAYLGKAEVFIRNAPAQGIERRHRWKLGAPDTMELIAVRRSCRNALCGLDDREHEVFGAANSSASKPYARAMRQACFLIYHVICPACEQCGINLYE